MSVCGSHSSRSEEHTSELQSRGHLVCRLLLEKKNKNTGKPWPNTKATLFWARHGRFTPPRRTGARTDMFLATNLPNLSASFFFFFFIDTPTTEIYTLSLHDALPISARTARDTDAARSGHIAAPGHHVEVRA